MLDATDLDQKDASATTIDRQDLPNQDGLFESSTHHLPEPSPPSVPPALPPTLPPPLHPSVPFSSQEHAELIRVQHIQTRYALCMARHQRLGAHSPARDLPCDVLKLIVAFLSPEPRLIITRHTVHSKHATKGYVVSNTRNFHVDVEAADIFGKLPDASPAHPLTIDASIVCEDGSEVPTATNGVSLLRGPKGFGPPVEEVVQADGRATFKLRMGPKLLSGKSGRGRFRIRFALRNCGTTTSRTDQIERLSEPMFVVSKIQKSRLGG